MPSPRALLEEVRRIAKPGARIYITVPNIGSYGFAKYRDQWYPLDLPRHLYHFDQATLSALCENAGLRLQSLSCRSDCATWLKTRQLERDSTIVAAGREPAERQLADSQWLRRLIRPWIWWLDSSGRGDYMEGVFVVPED